MKETADNLNTSYIWQTHPTITYTYNFLLHCYCTTAKKQREEVFGASQKVLWKICNVKFDENLNLSMIKVKSKCIIRSPELKQHDGVASFKKGLLIWFIFFQTLNNTEKWQINVQPSVYLIEKKYDKNDNNDSYSKEMTKQMYK